MRITYIYAILMIVLLLSPSCNKEWRYVKLLEEAERIADTNPDSSLYLLSRIITPGKLSPAHKADYAYLAGKIHYKQRKAMSEDSLILHSLDYYKANDIKEKLPLSYLLAVNYYSWNDNLPMLREIAAEGAGYGIETNDSALVSRIYSALGWEEYESQQYQRAIEAIHEAIKYSCNEDPSHPYIMGIYFSRLAQADSADYYFQKSIHTTSSLSGLGFRRRNYADFLTARGEYNKSLSLLHQNIQELGDTAHQSIARNYIGLRQLDSARFYLEKWKAYDLNITNSNLLMTAEAIINYTNKEPVNFSRQGQYNDSVFFKDITKEKILEEKTQLKNQLEQQKLLLTIGKQRTQLYITGGLLVIIILGFIIAFYILRKRKLLIEAEEKQEVLEKLLRETAETTNFSRKIVLQQLGLIRLVANFPTQHNQNLLKQVLLIDNDDTDTNQLLVWDDFYKVMDSAYDGFYSHIFSTYSNILTEKELQLCCLLQSGFSTKEISVLTNQKLQTIYQRKTTIRQKLRMNEKEDIAKFIIER